MATPSPTPEPSAPTPDGPSKAGQAARQVGRGIKTVLLIAVSVIATIFLLSNSQTVEVNYLFGTTDMPLFLALAIAMILGALIAFAVVGFSKVRRSSRK